MRKFPCHNILHPKIIKDYADEPPKPHLEAHVGRWGGILGLRATPCSRIRFLRDGKGRAMVEMLGSDLRPQKG